MQQLSFKSLYQPWNLSKLQDLSERNKEKCKKMKNKHQIPTLPKEIHFKLLVGEWYHLLGHHLVNTSMIDKEIRWEKSLVDYKTIWKIKVQEFL